jgi:hypothetical protein
MKKKEDRVGVTCFQQLPPSVLPYPCAGNLQPNLEERVQLEAGPGMLGHLAVGRK